MIERCAKESRQPWCNEALNHSWGCFHVKFTSIILNCNCISFAFLRLNGSNLYFRCAGWAVGEHDGLFTPAWGGQACRFHGHARHQQSHVSGHMEKLGGASNVQHPVPGASECLVLRASDGRFLCYSEQGHLWSCAQINQIPATRVQHHVRMDML